MKLSCFRFLLLVCAALVSEVRAQTYTFFTLTGKPARGNINGTLADARFDSLSGLAVDGAGNVFLADQNNRCIRKITPLGVVSTFAGSGLAGSVDGTGTFASFTLPAGLACDAAGNVYVADYEAATIRKISPAGAVTTVAGSAGSRGIVDGVGPAARFDSPLGITVDAANVLYVTDAKRVIRRIASDGTVTTIAGSPTATGNIDGAGVAARFDGLWGIVADRVGNLFVSETVNHTIRRVTAQNFVATFAGTTGVAGAVDGLGTSAQFDAPTLMAIDSGGNLLITDSVRHTIRRMTSSGAVTTIGGQAGLPGNTDGPGITARFAAPAGVAIDSAGLLYVSEVDNNDIRLGVVSPASPAVVSAPTGQTAPSGSALTLSVVASGTPAPIYQWSKDGTAIPNAVTNSLSLPEVQPATTGIYAVAATNILGTANTSLSPAIIGLSSLQKVLGSGSEVGTNIVHANGNVYDQVLLQGTAASVRADPGQVLRISYIDLNQDIVQVEFAGAGTLSLVLDGASGPAAPVNYNQPTVSYMRGHAGIVIVDADETTNVSVFSVGRANAVNQALFRSDVTYDGFADLAFIAIRSTNGKFGGVRAANASFFATRGLTGLYAPSVQFTGPVFIGDINGSGAATAALIIGSGADTRITGGDLAQDNGRPVQVRGLTDLRFVNGSSSHGTLVTAQAIRGRLEQNGQDVTDQFARPPEP